MSAGGGAVARTTVNKRELLLHDSLILIILIAVSLALFAITLLLFRSFESHRAALAARWGELGQRDLAQGRPEEAVSALHTALSYAPDERPDQLLLAQALAEAGHTEEATNYFLNLWEARPGDGFINLQLARLSRTRGEAKQAVEYYRASIFGSWEGDAISRRRQVRLELSDLLVAQHELPDARNELLTITGNAPNDLPLTLVVAHKLEAADDPSDALTLYGKVLTSDPTNLQALEHGGRLAYLRGDYAEAQRLLERAADANAHSEVVDDLLAKTRRIQLLTLTRDQPASDRAAHILLASSIAQSRLKSCIAQTTQATPVPSQIPISLAALASRWAAATAGHGRITLLRSAEAQDTWALLINQTALITAQTCGQPSGDDALLLQVAQSSSSAQ